jgi:hypothetical protein
MKTLIIDWIKENKYWVMLTTLVLLAAAVKTGVNAYNKQQLIAIRQKITENKDVKLITKILLAKPVFEKNYASQITQQLLETGNIEEAKALGYRAIDRLNQQMPSYAKFASASILICENNFTQALNISNQLQEELNGKRSSLALYNLRRIAWLQKKLNQEITVMEELKKHNLNTEEIAFLTN